MDPVDHPLHIELRPHGEALVCKLSGSATMETCERLNDRLADAAEGRPNLLVIDMADLDFICSLGLGSIVAAYLRARRHDGALRLAAPVPAVREVFEVTRLVTLLSVYDSTDEALGEA
ncbi:MAG: STAS domain-containing protein [Planctomycetota bacterium]